MYRIFYRVLLGFLLVDTSYAQNASRLVWGGLENSSITQTASYNNVINTARTTAATPFTAVIDIISGNPTSTTATNQAANFIQQAICARYAQDAACITHVIEGLLIWANTYVHVTATLDQILLLPWLQAYDLMRPLLATRLSNANLTILNNFTRGFITATDATPTGAADLFRVMRNILRTFASVILDDQGEMATSRTLLETLAASNLLDDGTTFDFNFRDSMGQHQRGLGFWVQMVTQTPFMLSESTFRRIERCVNFMRPFVNGSIVKIEFQNSQSSGDNAAKLAALAWVNSTSYTFLIQADIVFPSVLAWTITSPVIPRTSFNINNVLFSAWRLLYASNPLFISGSAFITTTPAIRLNDGPSQLIWGNITTASLAFQFNRVITLALTISQTVFPVVPVIVYEGVLPTDPAYIASRAATIKLPELLPVAICARFALQQPCITSVLQGLLAWATTYLPTGNPIDENLLIPWIQAYDLMRPTITNASMILLMDSFLRELIAKGDVYPNPPVPDNHIAWRFTTRALASVVLNDSMLITTSRELIDQFIIYNLFSDGSSYDFYARDALYYHVYNLEALIIIVLQAPQVFTETGLALIEAALNFIQPYYEGTKQHIEFLDSPIFFDYVRREAGLPDFQNVPWVPSKANTLLEESRVAFPSVNAWASGVPASTYSVTLLTTGAWALHFAAFPLVFNVSLQALTSAPATTPVDPLAGVTTTSKLIWGNLNAVSVSGTAAALIRLAGTTAQTLFSAVQVINSNDAVSKAATDRLGALREVAICAKLTRDTNCTLSVIQGLRVWADTYRHTGNPTNERLLIPWIQSYDLVRPILLSIMNTSTIASWDNFTRQFIVTGDAFVVSNFPDAFRTDRLNIRAFASVTLDDAFEMDTTRSLIENHAALNLFADGTSYDYRARDALQFHLRNLQSWVPIVAQTPALVSLQIRRSIEANLNFMQPYFQRTLIKLEFFNTTYSSDATRKAANLTWDPVTAQSLLFQAESVFPSVFAWTSQSIMNYTSYSLIVLMNRALRAYFLANPLFPVVVTTSRPVTSSRIQFRIVVTIRLAVPVQALTPQIQLGLREVFALAAGLRREDSWRVELIFRSVSQRRLLQASNQTIVDGVINMPNASSASTGVTQITNTSLNSGITELGLPPAVILAAPTVVEFEPDLEPTSSDEMPAFTPASNTTSMAYTWWIVGVFLFSIAVFVGVIQIYFENGPYQHKKSTQRREIPVPIHPPHTPSMDDHARRASQRWAHYKYNVLAI